MSDKLKELTPVLVSFVQGESPTPNKLENSFGQVATAMNILERAVGDVWNQNSITAGPLDLNPNYIANLSRAVGNMSKLNPKSLGGNVLSVSGTDELVPTGKKIFALNHAPDDPATPAAITFTNTTGVFEELKASIAAMVEDGDYFIDPSGLVYTFAETQSHYVTYGYTTVTDSYSGATYNVIPDPAQGARCTVIVSGSGYQIGLPVVTDSGSPNYLQQLTIPSDLSILEVDDEIPAGFMYVWDNTINTIVEGITFKKTATLTSVYAEGSTLALSAGDPDRYSLITVGSQITKMMEGLRDLILNHDHQDNQTPFIDHTKILGSDASVAHGTISDIMGIDDIQTVTNKTLVDPLFFDTGGAGFVTNVIIRVFEGQVAFRNSLDTEYQPLNLNCIPATLAGKSADLVDGFHAYREGTDTLSDDMLIPVDSSLKFPNSLLYTGTGNGLDADTVDGKHVAGTNGAGEITTNDGTQTLTNKSLNSSTIITATGDHLNELTSAGITSLHSHAAQQFSFRTYRNASDPSSFTVPAGVYWLFVEVWGGGGGGGGGNSSRYQAYGGGGGGSGGYAASLVAVNPTDVYPVTIATGGTAGAGHVYAGNGTNGGTGGTTSFGSVAWASGGGGGKAGQNNGGGGGGGTSYGSAVRSGASGGSDSNSGYNQGSGYVAYDGGDGAHPVFEQLTVFNGAGGAGFNFTANYQTGGNGSPGVQYNGGGGGGGSGSRKKNSGSGAVGAPGIIIIYY